MTSLADRLDSLLHQWLERHAATHAPSRADASAKGVVVVGSSYVEEVEALCSRWGMSAERVSPTVLKISGRMLPVRGLTEIAAGARA